MAPRPPAEPTTRNVKNSDSASKPWRATVPMKAPAPLRTGRTACAPYRAIQEPTTRLNHMQPIVATSCTTIGGYTTPPAARLEFLDGRTKFGDAILEGVVDTSEQVSPCLNVSDSNAATETEDTSTTPTRYASPLFDPRHAEDALTVETPHPTTLHVPLPVSAITAARGRKPPTKGPFHDDERSKPPLDNRNSAGIYLTSVLDLNQDPPGRREATSRPRH
jgi:hypothetical protein